MSVLTIDMYTTVERSIYHKLKSLLPSDSTYLIFNNVINKKNVPDCHGAIGINKIGDTPDFAQGGGAKAHLDTPVLDGNGHPQSYSRMPWPDPYDLMYQVEVSADTIDVLRYLENLLITALPPRTSLRLWDSDTSDWSQEWISYRWAGYINRDNPADNVFNRVHTLHCEARNYKPAYSIPAITSIDTSLTVNEVSMDEIVIS